ncbi:DUF7287 family protein [Halostagnicola kamekurae]|uniref:Uncharacterized protein n=1 Tax=Halostagnicola kamekurae TaxID=619731 RepID=A0A1I6SFY1_9EURY|nr:hypothetical protein [Halostagnicola kamekurae]SFS75847.1 hypothetical protein SAMN04488556_2643 [Halostagnicola kamekurae]
MRDDRRAAAGSARGDRGQTTQDFAIGVGVFLLAVAFAFTAIPGALHTNEASDERTDRAQADRIATAVVDGFETGDDPNELDGSRFRNEFDESTTPARVGLRTANGRPLEAVTITLETIDRESVILTRATSAVRGRPDETVERFVSVTDIRACRTACRLVVEVWS